MKVCFPFTFLAMKHTTLDAKWKTSARPSVGDLNLSCLDSLLQTCRHLDSTVLSFSRSDLTSNHCVSSSRHAHHLSLVVQGYSASYRYPDTLAKFCALVTLARDWEGSQLYIFSKPLLMAYVSCTLPLPLSVLAGLTNTLAFLPICAFRPLPFRRPMSSFALYVYSLIHRPHSSSSDRVLELLGCHRHPFPPRVETSIFSTTRPQSRSPILRRSPRFASSSASASSRGITGR